jgi:DNA-3-methyladenine glycosylase
MPRRRRPLTYPFSLNTPRPTREWFARPSPVVAVDLLGCYLVRVLEDDTFFVGRIVETEAYTGVEDRAAHSFGGRRTPRNEAMYAAAGTAYVYFTYGMHYCFNVVCGEVNEPVAVLIRALEPLANLDDMRRNRSADASRAVSDTDLCSGPAKLCQALQIDRALNGVDLVASVNLFILRGEERVASSSVMNTPRIGIDYAQEWVDRPLRWYVAENPHVSRGRHLKK